MNNASRDRWLNGDPDLLTTSANRNLLQPTKDNEIRRASNIKKTVETVTKKSQRKKPASKHETRSTISKGKETAPGPNGEEGRAPMLQGLLRHHSSGASSAKSDRSQLVDLVVEDSAAEEIDRVRARKEGSAAWNKTEPKRFVRTYGKDTGEDIREGYEPTGAEEEVVVGDQRARAGDGAEDEDTEEARAWKKAGEMEIKLQPKYGLDGEDFENVWGQGEGPSESPHENP